jgi:hypothetical protein
MQPYLHLLLTIGQWAQAHQCMVLTVSATVIVTLGIVRVTWRTALHGRRR